MELNKNKSNIKRKPLPCDHWFRTSDLLPMLQHLNQVATLASGQGRKLIYRLDFLVLLLLSVFDAAKHIVFII